MPAMKSVFVTGAGGFIGRHLIERLLAEDVEIVALMMPGEPKPDSWGDEVRIVTGDVRDLMSLASDIGPVDTVFHLAAVVSDWGARQTHVDITVGGTEQAIELALHWKAHFLVTTSICSYASALAKGVLTEESPLGKASSPYEFCKQEQERLTREAVVRRDLKATMIRPGNVFGVGSVSWVDLLVEALRGKVPCMIGSGDWDAGLVHVRNLVALMVAAARVENPTGDVFNATDEFGVTWKTYLTRLASIAGAPPPKSIPQSMAKVLATSLEFTAKMRKQRERPTITRQSYRLMGGPNEISSAKARRLLNYEPVMGFDDAMQELARNLGTMDKTGLNESPWIWVTGSASGLGRYLTGQLSQKGYRVLATDISDDGLKRAAREDHWPKERVVTEQLDVTDLGRWQALLSHYEEKGIVFSHLLNVAGYILPGVLFENMVEQTRKHLEINVMGSVNGCQTLMSQFQKRGAGHMVNVASFAGFGPAPGVASYCMSKAAVRSFSLGLAMDLQTAGSKIKVSCVCPDLIATPMMEKQVGFGDHSRLVFSVPKPLRVTEVGNLILGKVWDRQPMQASIPYGRGLISRILAISPDLSLKVFRRLEDKGRRNLEKARDEMSRV